MKKNLRYWFFVFILFQFTTSLHERLYAHHTGSTHSPTATLRFVDPFTGKREKPANYLVFTQDYYQSTRENSHLYTTTAYAETNFLDGRLSLNVSVPWNYYQQRNREDAARIGKTYIGAKFQPFFDLSKPYFFVIDASIGFPSGQDTDRFTGGNYYAGSSNMTFGYLYERFSFVSKVGGILPLSRPQPSNLQDNDGIPYYLRLPAQSEPAPSYDFLKTVNLSGYITYYYQPKLSFFTGFNYRNPYNGVEYSSTRDGNNPNYFIEGSIGSSYNFSEKYNLSFAYRYPLQRDRDYRLYQSAITLALSMELGD